ncbi:MAG: serine hydrolase domain-containing protein [Fimbriimonadales bacterium]
MLSKTLILASLVALMAPSDAPHRPISQTEQVDALFAPYASTPGAAVAVVRDGKIVMVKGYGLADVSAKTPITGDTAFDLASCSKPFTATAILLLAKQGKLNLDDPLTKSCPEFSGDAGAITIRHLLNHTSGIQDYERLFVESGRVGPIVPQPSTTKPLDGEPTSADTLKLLAQVGVLDFPPGSNFEYSNSGYVVLGQVVERVSEKRLSEFLSSEVFKKLRMRHSVLVDERLQPIPGGAHSYAKKGDLDDIDYTPLNRIYGDGNIHSSARDMAAWLGSLDRYSILPEDWQKQAWTPATLTGGRVTDYGFGWVVGAHNGEPELSHEGGWTGFESSILYFPKRRLGVVVLSNLEELPAGDLSTAIADIYLQGPQ